MPNWRGLGAFFDGFNQAYDTTGRVLQDVDLAKLAKEKPEDIKQPDQSGAGPMPDGSALSDSRPAQPDVKVGTKFLGKTYDTPLSDEQISNARLRAMADVIAKNDPARGLQLRNQVNQAERDAVRFDREGQRFDQEQVEAGLRTKGLQRSDRAGARVENIQAVVDQAAKLSDADLSTFAGQANKYGHIPLLYTGKTKAGYQFLSTDANGQPGKPMTFNAAQLRQIATATKLAEAGYGAESMQMFNAVSKELGDMVAQMNGVSAQAVNSQNQALHMGNVDANNAARLGMEGARLKLAQEHADRTKWAPELYQDADGNVRVFDVNRTSPGKPKIVERQMPAGMKPFSPKDTALKVNPDGSVVKDGKLYIPDPKTGAFKEARGIGPSATDLALARLGNGAQAAPGGTERPILQADIETERRAGMLEMFQKRPKRGLFAGKQDYEFYNPSTGETMSPAEYERLAAVLDNLDQVRRQRSITE